MIGQIATEFKKALSFNRVIIWFTILTIPVIIQLNVIRNGYVFGSPIEVFQTLISNYIPMLFPIFMIVVYTDSLISETKDNYLLYTGTRIPLATYIVAKGFVNAVLAFFISFLLVFLPFIYAVFIDSKISFVDYGRVLNNPTATSTFDPFLQYGLLKYGILYATWVGINGVLYATIPYLLYLYTKKSFIAMSIPFVWYQVMNFVTAIIGMPEFSPISTIFPFNIQQQALWTVLVPFSILLWSVIGMILFLMTRKKHEWVI